MRSVLTQRERGKRRRATALRTLGDPVSPRKRPPAWWRLKQCAGKFRCKTQAAGWAAVRRTVAETGERVADYDVYPCGFCRYWHYGHRLPGES